ncbi:ATP-binding protein [Paenibacillus mesophilus]|uniref:ATP-binding protein n=1 Tax=Paenibacillus mesophilus TaxID=2582849 RepID=UPI001EE45D92|nr:ATP-binding protein [Paenibacillus mesophilus]
MKHFWMSGLIVLIVLLTAAPEARAANAGFAPPSVREGVLNLSGWDLASDGPVPLDGEWELYWDRLLAPNDFLAAPRPPVTGFIDVPSFWSEYAVEGGHLPRYGYATYRLVITGNRSEAPMGIKLIYAYSAANIWVNGKPVRSFGQPGYTRQEEVPRFASSSVVDIGPVGDRIELVIQLSNFNNPQGGLISDFVIGTSERLHAMKQREVMEDCLVFGALLMMSGYHMILYALRRKDKSPLYFSLFCLCIAVRTLLSNSRFVIDLYPDMSWAWWAKLSYLTVYVGLFALASFIYHLFPSHIAKPILRFMQWFCAALTLLLALTDIRVYDKTLLPFEIAALLFMLYSIYAVIRAARARQDGAYLFLAGFIVILLAALNDMLSRLTVITTPALLQYGVLFVLFLQSVILSIRFSRSFAQVERLSERLLSLDKLKDEFLAKTSHELRTPLVGIIGITESLLDGTLGEPSPQARLMLQLIRTSGKRLSHLINDILDFAKLKNKDLHIKPVAVDVAGMTELVLALLQPIASKKGLALENHVTAGLFVHADENRLQQILHNLIGNAIKFTDEGFISVSAQPVDTYVAIRIADTGIGIPESGLNRIFESFEQLDSVMERHGGTGIGLAITKQLVELQQGSITVSSTVGEGSVFTFTLPAVVSARELLPELDGVPAAAEVAAEKIEVAAAAVPVPVAKPVRDGQAEAPIVMIVDDDPINIQVLVSFVGGTYRVLETCNGLEAVRWIREGVKPDIVLLDIMMPHISGFEICRRIRTEYNSGEMPVLFLSANNQIADLTAAFELGANDYIPKPADKQELLARIGMHLRLAQWNRSLEKELTIRTDKLEAVMRETARALSEISILEERSRIARDIHDKVGHTLTASIVQMEVAMMMTDKDARAAAEKLQSACELTRQGLREMRQSVHMLYEQSADLDLFSSLLKLVQDTEKYAEVVIERQIEPISHALPPEQEKWIYRALQEGITNGIRHGRCNWFKFALKRTGHHIEFILENDGLPFKPGKFGLGLTAMKQQAERWQGTFQIGSDGAAGCRLEITLPIQRR